MDPIQFIRKNVAAYMRRGGYDEMEVLNAMNEAERHYRTTSKFPKGAFEECLNHALRIVTAGRKKPMKKVQVKRRKAA